MLRQLLTLFAVALLVTSCGKTADKTAPGDETLKKKPEGKTVKPADKAASLKQNTSKTEPAAQSGLTKEALPAATDKATGDAPVAPAKPSAPDSVTGIKVEAVTGPAGTESPPAEKLIVGPVALVNDVPIDAKHYNEQVEKITRRSSKIPPERMNRIKENILKRIIEKELIRQAVATAGVVVPEDEIEVEFQEYKKRFRSEEQFDNYLKHGRTTIESIKNRLRERKSLELLLEKKGSLAVTDEESQEFYKKNNRFYEVKAGIKARHILIKAGEKASDAEIKKAKAKLKQAQAALKKGTPFEEVAKKFSEGPSAPKGGDLGFFGRGQMVKAFEDKAFTMKAGQVSGPVRTRFGFHIIQVLEKREARKKTFDEVKDTINESLRNKKFFQERRNLLSSLQQQAKIERKIEIPKAAPADPHAGHGHGTNPHGGVVSPTRRAPVPRRPPVAVPPTPATAK